VQYQRNFLPDDPYGEENTFQIGQLLQHNPALQIPCPETEYTCPVGDPYNENGPNTTQFHQEEGAIYRFMATHILLWIALFLQIPHLPK
jgi:hypothetical protein